MRSSYFGVIYCICNKINGKKYVGQTKRRYPEHRFRGHIEGALSGSQTYLANAIRKYGQEAFEFEVIWPCDSQDALDVSEDSMIELLGTMTPNGYNMKRGGQNGGFAPEVIARLSVISSEIQSRPEVIEKHRISAIAAHARPEVKERFLAAVKNINTSPEARKRSSILHSKSRWINNGIINKRIKKNDQLPEGWTFGLVERSKNRLKSIAIGTYWITDGNKNRRISKQISIPNGWRRGKVHKTYAGKPLL